MKRALGILCVIVLVIGSTGIAIADDIHPPSWAEGPNSVVAWFEDQGSGLLLDDWWWDGGSPYPITPGIPSLGLGPEGIEVWMPNF